MGFRSRNATLLLTLLGLGSILGVNGSWLFEAMEERERDYRRAMQPRQFDSCSSGSKACGRLGCVASRRCCNADAEWGCEAGHACYTVNGFVDCYSTTIVMPTASRKCYDNTATGCDVDQACFTCNPTSAYCATELISGGDTWLTCAATTSMVLTITPGIPKPTGSELPTIRIGTPTATRTGTTTSPTNTPTPDKLGGGAIAGIAIGALAAIAMAGALIYFFCVRNKRSPDGAAAVVQPQYAQPQQPQMPYQQPPYSPPSQQQPQYMTQQYGPPGYQGQMAHNGYGPDGQPMVPPISSPVYPEHPKQPVTMPAELH